MPDILSFPQRRSSVSSSFHQATATNLPGASAARRPLGLLSSLLEFIRDVFGFGVKVETGRYLCPICLGVYEEIDEHVCLTTAYCMDCDRRVVIETRGPRGSACSECHRTSYVLARRGV